MRILLLAPAIADYCVEYANALANKGARNSGCAPPDVSRTMRSLLIARWIYNSWTGHAIAARKTSVSCTDFVVRSIFCAQMSSIFCRKESFGSTSCYPRPRNTELLQRYMTSHTTSATAPRDKCRDGLLISS